jgi:hypothetical protein
VAALAILCLSLAVGCRHRGDHSDGERLDLYDTCFQNADCSSGVCQQVSNERGFGELLSFCSKPCSGDAACAGPIGGFCRPGPAGAPICVPPCGRDNPGLFACVGGAPVFCAGLDETHCESCGCPTDRRCAPGQGCVLKSEVGEACLRDDDCRTQNCSTFAGVCRVPVGTACRPDDCDVCITSDPAKMPGVSYSYCSRECRSGGQCNGGLCLSFANTSLGEEWSGACYGSCNGFVDSACPNKCDFTQDSLSGRISYYCACQGCQASSPPRGEGAPCRASVQCARGSCLTARACDGNRCETFGYCAAACDASNPCAAGQLCVELPCAPGSTSSCGRRCLLACDGKCRAGACRALPDLGGGAAMVCDLRRADGQGCADNSDCVSGRCIVSICRPASGVPNGGGCTRHEECVSGNCQSGLCRGKAILGDPCTGGYDCSVGTCCSSGAHQGTCQTNC